MKPRKGRRAISELEGQRLYRAFARVKAYIMRRPGGRSIANISLRVCLEIRRGLRGVKRARAYMHTGHVKRHICTTADAAKLSDGFLFGILFHEFGHVFVGVGEGKADQWVFEKLGIVIHYKSQKKLEWVDPKTLELKAI